MRFLPFLLPCKGQPFPPERSSRTFQGVLQFRLPPLEASRIFCGCVYPNCKSTEWMPRIENEKPLQFLPCTGMKIAAVFE